MIQLFDNIILTQYDCSKTLSFSNYLCCCCVSAFLLYKMEDTDCINGVEFSS